MIDRLPVSKPMIGKRRDDRKIPRRQESSGKGNVMTLFLNEEDMHKNLAELLPEGETYQVQIWGLLLGGSSLERFILGKMATLNNVCTYLGVTEKHLVMALMGTVSISQRQGELALPLDEIDQVQVKHSFLPGKSTVILQVGQEKIKLSLMSRNPVTASIKNQKEEIATFCSLLAK